MQKSIVMNMSPQLLIHVNIYKIKYYKVLFYFICSVKPIIFKFTMVEKWTVQWTLPFSLHTVWMIHKHIQMYMYMKIKDLSSQEF